MPWDANYEEALVVINNWRSSHGFPLNTFHIGLRQRASSIDPNCVTSERIKRLASIEQKLVRFRTHRLSQMQDIGGCRAVLRSNAMVAQASKAYQKSDLKHKLVQVDDYILKAKRSGYRGIHLIYRYHSDRKTTYNGLNIEIQLRSQLQHAWATAVETVGTFIQQALKSSQGEEEWLHFFSLMGSALAAREGTPSVPGVPEDHDDLVRRIRECERKLQVVNKLMAYRSSLNEVSESPLRGAHYYLLKLEPGQQKVTLTGFKRSNLEEAATAYLDAERSIKGGQGSEAVLVSVDSLAALRRAYPNYFLDTDLFIDALRNVIE